MHVFSLKRVSINGIQNKKMKWKIQIIITLMHISSLITVVLQSLLFRNEKKLVAILVYSWFIRVATSAFRMIP